METISLQKYGPILTGRPFGKQISEELLRQIPHGNVEFDFGKIISLGSSFGEEVVVPFARRQNNNITVRSANVAVKRCLELIAKDFSLQINFL
jgi:hypothetical protein